MSSVDGRIDCDMTEKLDDTSTYYEALDLLNCCSQLMGRVTVQLHYNVGDFAEPATPPIGHEAYHVATRSEGYTIVIDSQGTLTYRETTIDGKPLLVIVGEDCSKVYLDRLGFQGISWIATGKGHVDLKQAMELAARHFGIDRIALVGGGHINGAFLEAGLLDEVSLMIGAGIDGRAGMTSVFDGIANSSRVPVLLNLQSIQKTGDNTVWLRYSIRQ